MKLRQFNSQQLKLFIESGEYARYNILPITRQRALSQIQNPQVKESDILLIVAFNSNNEIIGFCGMMPGKINLGDRQRVFWNSCWWVDPKKGSKSSMPLFYTMLKNAHQNMIFADMTYHTSKLLGITGFFNQPEMPDAIRGYARICFAQILPPKSPVLKKATILLKVGDGVLNTLLFPWYRFVKFKLKKGTTNMILMNEPDEESKTFINNDQDNQLAPRDAKDLCWIKNNPWVGKKPNQIESVKKYPFTSYSSSFETWFAAFEKHGKTVGVAYFSFRDGHLKIPYICLINTHAQEITAGIFKIIVDKKVMYFTTFHPILTEAIKSAKHSPFLFKKPVRRLFAISKSFPMFDPQKLILQDGDGDAIFT